MFKKIQEKKMQEEKERQILIGKNQLEMTLDIISNQITDANKKYEGSSFASNRLNNTIESIYRYTKELGKVNSIYSSNDEFVNENKQKIYEIMGGINKYFNEWSLNDETFQFNEFGLEKIAMSEIHGVLKDKEKSHAEKMQILGEYVAKNLQVRKNFVDNVQFNRNKDIIKKEIETYLLENNTNKYIHGAFDIDKIKDKVKIVVKNNGIDVESRDDQHYLLATIKKIVEDNRDPSDIFYTGCKEYWDGKNFKQRVNSKSSNNSDGDLTNFSVNGNSKSNLESIAGLNDVKKIINSEIIFPLKNPEIVDMSGGNYHHGFLLYGAPGCGKTMIAKSIAGELDKNIIIASATDILSKWVGDSEKNIKNLFDKARQDNAVIFIDEIDSLIPSHNDDTKGYERKVISQFLTEMDGAEDKEKVIVVAATNNPWDIYVPFLRPGRFDKQIYIGLPDSEAKMKILNDQLNKSRVSDKVNLEKIISKTEGFSGADVVKIATEANMLYRQEKIIPIIGNIQSNNDLSAEEKQETIKYALNALEPIGQELIEKAKNNVNPSVAQKMVENYEKWGKNPWGRKDPKDDNGFNMVI